MKPMLMFALLVVATLMLAPIPSAGQKPAKDGTEDQTVRKVFDEYVTAIGHNDAAVLDRMWAADYTFVSPSGTVANKEQRLAGIKSGDTKFESFTCDDVTVHSLDKDAAVVIARATVKGRNQGQDLSGQYRVTSVLAKKDGHWQIVAGQSTRIAQQ
jgi:uncharacterized protein (TIGR02246 family)